MSNPSSDTHTSLIIARSSLLLDSALHLASSLPVPPANSDSIDAEQSWAALGQLPRCAFRWSLIAGLLVPQSSGPGQVCDPPVWHLERELVRGGERGVVSLILLLKRLNEVPGSYASVEEVISCHEFVAVVRGAVWAAVGRAR